MANGQSIVVEPNSTNTQVDYSNNEYNIQGGALSEDGSNLFHSFNEFNLNSGETASFVDEVDTQNILGSVTGGKASFIDGLLQVVGSDANLYLLNPAGIFFGANARLNLLGSFTATTATHVEFGDHWLSVLGINDYQTLVETPTAFAFGTSSPASVINTGDLGLRPGQTLRLLGGSVVNTGSLSSADGVIEVVAVPGESTVRITQEGFLLSLDLPKVSSDNPELIAPSGLTELPVFLTGGGDDHATQIVLANDGSVSLQSADDVSGNLADLDGQDRTVISGELDVSGEYGGSIDILGGAIQLLDAEISANGFQGAGSIRIGGDYRGLGNLPLASQLWVDSGTSINANAINRGNGGSVVLWADNQTQFFGSVAARGGELAGNGGFTEISGRDTLTFQGEVDLSAVNGQLGTLLLDPENIIIRGDVGAGSADGQLPEISSGTLLGETATLSQEALENIAETADVVLEATNDIRIEALDNDELDLGNGTERVGAVTFIADADQNGQGAFVSDTQSTILTNTRDINISGATIAVGNIRTGLQQSGRGGDVSLTAVGDVTAGFFDTGEGDAGDIRIVSDQGDITVDRFVSTSSGPGDGGTIDLVSGGDILLREGIFSLSRQDGRGGPINLTGTGANSQIEVLGNVEFGSEDGLPSGALTINTPGDVILAGELTNRGGADIFVGDEVAPQTLSLLDNVISNGDDIFLRAGEILTTLDINTSSNTIGGTIDIASEFGDVNLGNLTTNGVESGGAVTLFSGGALSAGLIDTSATPGDGGDVQLGAREDIEVSAINSQGGVDGGGVSVDIATDRFLRVTDTFTDQNGIDASISAAGGAGNGAIDIEHGGLGVTPFIVGDASVNGTAGAITAGLDNTLEPIQTIFGSISTGSISIRTEISTVVAGEAIENSEISTTEVEAQSSEQLAETSPLTSQQLLEIQKATGIKPAVLRVAFMPYEEIKYIDSTNIAIERRRKKREEILTLTLITAENEYFFPIRSVSRSKLIHHINILYKQISSGDELSNDYLMSSEQLYDWLITPIRKKLLSENIENIVFSLDKCLSHTPLAALKNNKSNQFLIEEYSIGLIPEIDLTNYEYVEVKDLGLTFLGLEREHNYSIGLEGIKDEREYLEGVWARNRGTREYFDDHDVVRLQQVENFRSFTNESFDSNRLEKRIGSENFALLHIATHGRYDPESLKNSYIRLGSGQKYFFKEMRENNIFSQLELVVLSACETVISNSLENSCQYDQSLEKSENTQEEHLSFGFAGLAYGLGAKSAMGALWEVKDDSTPELMKQFYTNLSNNNPLETPRDTKVTKAEALRQAQLHMLNHANSDFRHPSNWAAFMIVGSPW